MSALRGTRVEEEAAVRVIAPHSLVLDAVDPDRTVEILLEVVEAMTADGGKAALNRLAALALRATGADRCAILVRDLRPPGWATPTRYGGSSAAWSPSSSMTTRKASSCVAAHER
jgi:hypothetical protein